MSKWPHILLLLVIPLMLTEYSDSHKSAGKMLLFSLMSEGSGYRVADFQVTDKDFQESKQQGLYEAHLIDSTGNILQKVNFEKMKFPSSSDQNNQADFSLALPLIPELYRIKLYKLDGSSGHYQLKTDNPLL